MKKMWLMLVLALEMWTINAYAQKPAVGSGDEKGRFKIGEISASFNKETESIIVVVKDEFSSLKLRAENAPITIDRVQIFFEGGKVQEAEVKQLLLPGEETKAINLYAEDLRIEKVVFTYKTNANEKVENAGVELYGFKLHGDETGPSEAAATKDDLKEEGENAVDKIQKDAKEAQEKVNEAASKANAEIIDEKLEEKTGPNGQTIYLDDNKNYYWVDEQGTKRYISVLELKDKE
jgi:hypothetical protein